MLGSDVQIFTLFGQLTHTRRSDVAQPNFFFLLVVDTSGRLYHDFSHLLFWHAHRETSGLDNELSRNRINFVSFVLFVKLILRGLWVWFWRKYRSWGFLYRSVFHRELLYHCRVSFRRSRRPTPLLAPSLFLFPSTFGLSGTCWVFILAIYGFSSHHSFSVTSFPLGLSPFFYSAENKHTKNPGLSLVALSCLHDSTPRPFIPLPRFLNSRRAPPLPNPSLVLFPQHSAWVAHDVRSFTILSNKLNSWTNPV
jgi:hypothetical protein